MTIENVLEQRTVQATSVAYFLSQDLVQLDVMKAGVVYGDSDCVTYVKRIIDTLMVEDYENFVRARGRGCSDFVSGRITPERKLFELDESMPVIER